MVIKPLILLTLFVIVLAGIDNADAVEYKTVWTDQFGSVQGDWISGATISNGNIVVAGTTDGLIFDIDLGNFEGFVRMYNTSGAVQWSDQFGTINDDYINAVTTSNGNIAVAGHSGYGLESLALNGTLHVYNTSGTLLWNNQFGTTSQERVYAATTDSNGNIVVAGDTLGSLFGTNAGGHDGFVHVYNTSGTVQWSNQFGTSGHDRIYAATADSNGNIVVAGDTEGSLFGTNAGGFDAFIHVYNSTGTVQWSDQFGGSNYDKIHAVTVDSNGNIVVAGSTGGTILGQNPISFDAFIRVYNATGAVQWSDQFGTNTNDKIHAVTVDSNGNIVVAGDTSGSLFGTSAGSSDAFIRIYNSTGAVLWSEQFGTSSGDKIYAATADSNGNIVVAGSTSGSLYGTNVGQSDAFIRTLQIFDSVPPAPTSLTTTPLKGTEMNLTWSAPTNNGGYTITGYQVDYKKSSVTSWVNAYTVTDLYATPAGLTNGESYDFRVAAINAKGIGANATATATPIGVPNTPTALIITSGNTQVLLSWSAPFDNGSTISDYIIQYSTDIDTWQTFADGNSTGTTTTVTGLTNNIPYYFKVAAVNALGAGTYVTTTSITPSTTPPTAPHTPTSLTATPLKGTEMNLTWNVPTNNGGYTITGYQVDYKKSSVTSWVNAYTVTDLYATPAGLTNGESYDFRVAAINAKGIGANATATATPIGVPNAPTALIITSGNTEVALTLSTPFDNGSTITDYIIQYSTDIDTWQTFADGTSSSTTDTVTGLTNNTPYYFKVAAVNSAGTGTYVTTINTITPSTTPYTTPDTPTSLTATSAKGTEMNLTWDAPTNNGGSTITGYQVDYKKSSGSSWVNPYTVTDLYSTLTGLTNGESYDFRVAAINAKGVGSNPTTTATPIGTPNAPTSLTTFSDDSTLTVSWSAPTSDGGSTIMGYTAQYSTDGANWTTFAYPPGVVIDSTISSRTVIPHSESKITITGLTNGVDYYSRVAAFSTVGTGPYVTTPSTTTVGVPNIPTNISVSGGNSKLTVSWSVPTIDWSYADYYNAFTINNWSAPTNNGGSPIIGYKVEVSTDGTTWSTSTHSGIGTTSDVTGLTNGVDYYSRVAAFSTVGTGPYVTTTSTTTPG